MFWKKVVQDPHSVDARFLTRTLEEDEARINNYKQQTALSIETAKLEARWYALSVALKENDILRNLIIATKDDQINNLKVLITEAIKALQQHPVEIKK